MMASISSGATVRPEKTLEYLSCAFTYVGPFNIEVLSNVNLSMRLREMISTVNNTAWRLSDKSNVDNLLFNMDILRLYFLHNPKCFNGFFLRGRIDNNLKKEYYKSWKSCFFSFADIYKAYFNRAPIDYSAAVKLQLD